ncbi:MAG: hypothetical protein ACWGN2_11150 [Anaerolineales bacterium]
MSQERDFKKLQQRTYASYHQDGLIDMIVGWAITGFGINMALDNSAFLFLSWLPIILYVPIKNRVTIPRIGYVKFSSKNSLILGILLAILLVLLLGIFILLIAGPNLIPAQISEWFREYYLLLFGGLVGLGFAYTALATGITRFYAYAVMLVLVFAMGIWLNVPDPIYVLTAGLFILVAGIMLMVRFLRKYPVVNEGGINESE